MWGGHKNRAESDGSDYVAMLEKEVKSKGDYSHYSPNDGIYKLNI